MIRLIKNEFTKMGIIKFIVPYILFLSIIVIKYFFNGILVRDDILELIQYVGIILCILFSGIVSNEMVSGTFKYYLTKSNSRVKVLSSKILFIYIYTFLLLLFLIIAFFIINRYIDFSLLCRYLCYSVPVYCILTISLLLSILIKNTPINLGTCIFLFIFSGTIAEFLFQKNVSLIQYTILPYFDFNIFTSKESILLINAEYGINLNGIYATIINIFHIIVLNLISYFIFIKKDIKC